MTAPQLDLDFAVDTARTIERLVPIARELAARAGRHGICVADVRLAAVQRGYLTGEERGRRLSFLGAVMRKAGLVQTGDYRRSVIDRSHGNLHAVWVLEEFGREAAS